MARLTSHVQDAKARFAAPGRLVPHNFSGRVVHSYLSIRRRRALLTAIDRISADNGRAPRSRPIANGLAGGHGRILEDD